MEGQYILVKPLRFLPVDVDSIRCIERECRDIFLKFLNLDPWLTERMDSFLFGSVFVNIWQEVGIFIGFMQVYFLDVRF